jgi:hypothetical protein
MKFTPREFHTGHGNQSGPCVSGATALSDLPGATSANGDHWSVMPQLVHRLISGRHTAVGDLADFQGASDEHTEIRT